MKKAISLLLSLVIAFSALMPAFSGLDFAEIKAEAATGSNGAYATLFTTSDLQVNDYYKQMETMMSYAVDDGYGAPDAFLFGGDFQTSSNAEESVTHHMDNMESLFHKFFPYYHTDNLVLIKGNHDARDERHYETGLYEFDNFVVYVINEDDYRAGNLADAKTASENLKFALDRLLTAGNDKPVFVMTHVPFHHNSRGGYGQSAYGRYMFDVLNLYGNYMDIIFLFGHNHSGKYDDYIGGSVNYLGVGDTIYISSYDGKNNLNYGATHYTDETLTFTYANYGYGGYSNNTEGTVTDTDHSGNTVKSTKIETMGVFDIYEDKITLSRYTLDGKYNEVKTIDRKTPTAADGSYSTPYVNVAGHTKGTVGAATGAVANAVGFGENATYSWNSSNTNIAKVNDTSSVCQVSYVGEGTATITVTVSDGTHTASASYDVEVSGNTVHSASASVLMGHSYVKDMTLEYYELDFPYTISLLGHYTAAVSVSNEKWETSDASVATVDNGLVTFVDNGTATITYRVDIVDVNGTKNTYKASVTYIVSNGEKQELGEVKYVQTSTLEAGKEYAIVIDYKGTKQILTEDTNLVKSESSSGNYTTHCYYPKATTISVQGSSGSYYFTGDYDACTWKAVSSSTANAYHFQNIVSSNYFNLVGSKKINTDGSDGGINGYYKSAEFSLTPSTVWSYSSDYGVLFDKYSIYARNGYAETIEATDRIRTDSEKPMFFERVITGGEGTEAHIEMGAEYVEDSIKTIYRVTNDTSIRLYGEHKNYGSNVVETWSSSKEDIAKISADGTVDFTGASGETIITYTVKSDNVQVKSLTFTLVAKNGREATRTFRYVENIQTDRPYIFVNKSSLTPGDGFALSTSKISNKAMLPADIEIKQNEIRDYLYVEIPVSSSGEYVWTTNGTDPNFVVISTEKTIQYTWWKDLNGDGEINWKEDGTSEEITYSKGYLEGVGVNRGTKSIETTEYLGAKITGYGEWGTTGELYTLPYSEVLNGNVTDITPHQFHYNGSELYNNYEADVVYSEDPTKSYQGLTAVGYHGSHYYGIGGVGSSYSRVYAFEEVFPDPTAVILSNYEYIGKNVTRDEVCPYQTEQLMPEAQNFPDGTKTYTWSSSNTDVATIDANGKITYTGKAGKTTITLTITNTSDVNENIVSESQTVEITVNPSQIVEGGDDVIYAENAFYKTTELVPGKKYVLHTNHSEAPNLAISNVNKSGYVRLLCETIDAPLTDSNGEYVVSTNDAHIWECVGSNVPGYVYFKNVATGEYLFTSESATTTAKRQAGVASNLTHPEAANVTNPENTFLFTYDNSKGMLFSKQVEDIGSAYGIGNVAKSSSGYYYIRPTYDGSSGSPVSFITLYAEPEKQSVDSLPEGDNYLLTDGFVPGNKYVITTSGDVGAANTINNSTGHSSNGYDYLKNDAVEVISAGSSLCINNPPETSVWECFPSGTSGYYYLKDNNGNYMVVVCDEDAATPDATTPQSITITSDLSKYDPEEYLIKYRTSSSGGGYFGSKASEAVSWFAYYNSGNGRHYSMRYSTKYYLYSLVQTPETEDSAAVTQIRINGSTASKDITNQVYNRYFIENGDNERLLRYVKDVKPGYTYEWSSSDTSIATIDNEGLVTYTGKEGYVVISLKVTGSDINGIPYTETVITTLQVFNGPFELSSNDYPEYPYEGSVRVNKTASNTVDGYKFQETGITEIELGATGVPVTRPVDIVVVFDHSTSMNDSKKLQTAMDKTQEFALKVLENNPNNRIAIVAFDSMGSRYESAISSKVNNTLNEAEAGIITGDGTIENAFVTAGDEASLIDSIDSLSTNNQGNTNYDYGLKKAYDILKYAKVEENSPNDRIVVFMSDGEPNQFNGVQIDSSTDENNAIREAWLTGDKQFFIDNGYLNADGSVKDEYPALALFNDDGDNWYAKALKTPVGEDSNLPAYDYYVPYQTGLGAKIFSIGYHTTDTFGALRRMASTPADYFNDIGSDLSAAFDKIISQVFYAASNAVVTDKMGAQFDVQFAPTVKVQETSYTFSPSFEVGAWTLDNSGNRVEYNVIEKITFTTNSNGNLTGATSTLIGDAFDEAASTVAGQYISYNLINETFIWNIGDINRSEVTLKYYASLTGAAKGEREAGVYNTNESATLSYTNYRGAACSRYFPVPTLAWKQAAVSYEFYLVNADGKPVGLAGNVVPFAERVIIGLEQTKPLLLYSEGEVASSVAAQDVLPEGYELFNAGAVYNITVSSTGGGIASISDNTLTTYFRNGAYAVNVNGEIPDVTSYYNTAVSFAVKASEGVVPDAVVIDYGLPVKIQVLGNDYVVDGGKITGIAKTVAADTQFNDKPNSVSKLVNGGPSDVQMTYGKVSIATDNSFWYPEHLVYTPTTTNMPEEDVFYYEYKVGNNYYYGKVTVIPATNIYYEESFMTFVDGTREEHKWETLGETLTEKFQAEDRPGNFAFNDFDANNAYGYDEAYSDSYTYSLGSAKKATVNYNSRGDEPTATFTFCGTGFSLYSVTNNTTGAVMVTIYKAGTKTVVKNFLVDTYYGYSGEGDSLAPIVTDGGMYQVPVINRSDLDYGTYDVVIKPLYSSAFDADYDGTDSSDNKYSIYVDSVRIYNPAGNDGNGNSTITDAYLNDGEMAPVYEEIRDIILTAEDFSSKVTELGYNGAIFLDGKTDAGLATYKAQGPKNEIYLAPNQAIAFMVKAETTNTLASLQLGMKVVAGGETAKVSVMNTSEKSPKYFELTSAHEMFRDIDAAIVWNQDKVATGGGYETKYPIVIANVSDSEVISLTSLKWAFTANPEGAVPAVDFMVYEDTPAVAMFAMRRAMVVAQPYNAENVTISWSDTTFTEGKEATLTVVTPPEITAVTVDGIDVTECEIDEDGNKVWTYTFVVKQTGENAYDIMLFDANGVSGEPIKTETIYVEEAPEETTTEAPETETPSEEPETEEPSEETTEAPTVAPDEELPEDDDSQDDDSQDDGKEENNILSRIIEFIKTLINFFRRLFA